MIFDATSHFRVRLRTQEASVWDCFQRAVMAAAAGTPRRQDAGRLRSNVGCDDFFGKCSISKRQSILFKNFDFQK